MDTVHSAQPHLAFASRGGKVKTPLAQWPSEERLRAGYRAAGFSPEQIENKISEQQARKKQIKELSEDFEAQFVSMLMKEMKKNVHKNELFDGGRGEEIFDAMLTSEQAKVMTSGQQSFGIAEMVEQKFIRALGGNSFESVKHDAFPESAPHQESQSPDRETFSDAGLGKARSMLLEHQRKRAYQEVALGSDK